MYDEYLAHYGVKGMKWRHRKAVYRLNQARRNQLDQELEIKELERMERQEKAERSGETRAEKNAPKKAVKLKAVKSSVNKLTTREDKVKAFMKKAMSHKNDKVSKEYLEATVYNSRKNVYPDYDKKKKKH